MKRIKDYREEQNNSQIVEQTSISQLNQQKEQFYPATKSYDAKNIGTGVNRVKGQVCAA